MPWHTLSWNYISFFVAAFVLVLIGLKTLSDRAARDREAFARSIPGSARVLKVGNSTPSRGFSSIILDLLIEVTRSGVPPYQLSTMWSVEASAVPKVQPGQTFAIKVDPLDRNRIYSAETWAHSLGVKKQPIE